MRVFAAMHLKVADQLQATINVHVAGKMYLSETIPFHLSFFHFLIG